MIVDHKPNPDVSTQLEALPEASTSERKLSINLPNPKQIYTAGSTVVGLVHLSLKDIEKVEEVKISLVCSVRSIHHRNYGQSHDVRRETTKLIHRDQNLWTHSYGGPIVPPVTLPFEIVIPEVGNDRRAKDPNSPLPPSFHAGRHRGWKNMMTYGTRIGFIKYYVKVSVVMKGILKRNEKAFCPFVFFPPSPPPQLLPPLPETIPDGELALPEDQWCVQSHETTLRHAIFSTTGRAHLTLWLPRLSIPMSPSPLRNSTKPRSFFDKRSAYARNGRHTHEKLFDAAPTDNMLHGLVPQIDAERVVWRGLWTSLNTPNFKNRQFECEYTLVVEVPIKGIGNCAKVVSQTVEISSGVTAGSNITPSPEDDQLDIPPEYFEADGSMSDEDEDDDKSYDEKA